MFEALDIKAIALVVLILSGINWGIVAFKKKDIIELYDLNDIEIAGKPLSTLVYLIFCASGIYLAFELLQSRQKLTHSD